jgi:hypothetical protein
MNRGGDDGIEVTIESESRGFFESGRCRARGFRGWLA